MSLPKHLIWLADCRKTTTSISASWPISTIPTKNVLWPEPVFAGISTGGSLVKRRVFCWDQPSSMPASVMAFWGHLGFWHVACVSQSSESTRLRTRSDSPNRSNTFRRVIGLNQVPLFSFGRRDLFLYHPRSKTADDFRGLGKLAGLSRLTKLCLLIS